MATLTYNGESYTVDHAAKGADYIHGYNANGVLIVAFDGVTDFSGFTYSGEYMEPSECLAESCNTVRYCGGKLKTLDGKTVDVVIAGGTASDVVSLGQTPVTLTKSANIRLVGDGEHSYTIKGKTVADLSTAAVTKTNIEITEHEGYIELTATGGEQWYDSYAVLRMSGFTVGANYVLAVQGFAGDEANGIGGSYIIIQNANGTQLAASGGIDQNKLFSIAFSPDTESIKVAWYVANNYYWRNNCKTSRAGDIYINEATDGTERTAVINESGTFTDSYSLGQLSKGITITSTPSCEVYSASGGSSSGEAGAPLAGKTIVCFGDSLFGMYTGGTSAPAYAALKTGATVYNVGFGGCRMSEHPYTGYNEFCMYALADAIASGDWSAQDAAASQGSANFPDQLTVLKGIDFGAVDAIVIHYGTNDFAAGDGVAIDSADNPKATNTLCGALRHSVETLLTAYPKLRIFVSLPAFRYWDNGDGTVTYSDEKRNADGYTLPDFVKALAETAKEYKLPIIDCYYGLGINKSNASTFLADGTHHNVDGRKRFGEYIGAKLISEGDSFSGASPAYVVISTEDGSAYTCQTTVSALEALLSAGGLIMAKITTDTGALFAQLFSYETSSYGRIVMFALGAMVFTLTPTATGHYEVAVS